MIATMGLHHVTAIASGPRTNIGFYRDALGQRLVKRTVNFDEPSSHHLYYGDVIGSPGTIVTFFPLPGAPRGVPGTGEAGTVSYAIDPTSVGHWHRRLTAHGISAERMGKKGDSEVLRFRDPDGTRLELVAAEQRQPEPVTRASVGLEHAIRGLHSVTLTVADPEPTVALLVELLGYRVEASEQGLWRLSVAAHETELGSRIDVEAQSKVSRARPAVGSIHHIAFRVKDEYEQRVLRERLLQDGHDVTSVKDRLYFRSVYFREPGGVLFELATDGPGFTVDEDRESLGASLKLPPWLEGRREEIEDALPSIEVSAGKFRDSHLEVG